MPKHVQTRLVLPDVHIPFHDRHLVDAWLAFAAKVKPDGIDILGDVIDCYKCSRFDHNPERRDSLQDEIDQCRSLLEEVRSVAGRKADIKQCCGNHEDRVRRLLWTNSKAFADIRGLSIPALLGLDRPMVRADKTAAPSLNIEFFPLNTPYYIGNLGYFHGDMSSKGTWQNGGSGSNAKKIIMAKRISCVVGHDHQLGYSCVTDWQTTVEGFQAGCVCLLTPEYIQGMPPWQQGWLLTHHFDNGDFSIEFVRSVVGSKGQRRLLFRDQCVATLPKAK